MPRPDEEEEEEEDSRQADRRAEEEKVPPLDRRRDRQEEAGGETMVSLWLQELRLVQPESPLLATRTARPFSSSPHRRDQQRCLPTMEMVVVVVVCPWRNIQRFGMQ